MTHILQDKQLYKKVREMNTVSVQQKALSTALLHTSQDKKNKEMQNNTENEINEAFSENLFF